MKSAEFISADLSQMERAPAARSAVGNQLRPAPRPAGVRPAGAERVYTGDGDRAAAGAASSVLRSKTLKSAEFISADLSQMKRAPAARSAVGNQLRPAPRPAGVRTGAERLHRTNGPGAPERRRAPPGPLPHSRHGGTYDEEEQMVPAAAGAAGDLRCPERDPLRRGGGGIG